jgi:hypothetical protein
VVLYTCLQYGYSKVRQKAKSLKLEIEPHELLEVAIEFVNSYFDHGHIYNKTFFIQAIMDELQESKQIKKSDFKS